MIKQTAFLATALLLHATTAYSATINFDDLAVGTTVTEITTEDGTVSFSSNTGLDLIVSAIFDTSSGTNYLGVENASELFIPGDVITLNFSDPINYFSVDFIGSPGVPTGAFALRTSQDEVISGPNPDQTLPDGSEVFRLSISSDTAFFSVELAGLAVGGDYTFNIDTIEFRAEDGSPSPVPEPMSLALLAPGLALLLRRRSGKRDPA